MEIFKIITHAPGGENYVDNATDYVLDGREVLALGYGINPNNADSAGMQFKQTARFWDNQDKNPLIHCMISYSTDTAPTAEDAMRLTGEILEPLTDDHLALSVAHNETREGSSYHSHTLISTTNLNDGTMLYADNKSNYALAQRAADVTGQPVALVVMNDRNEEWECPRVFIPQTDEDDDE